MKNKGTTCIAPACRRGAVSKGYCAIHYQTYKYHADKAKVVYNALPLTPEERDIVEARKAALRRFFGGAK